MNRYAVEYLQLREKKLQEIINKDKTVVEVAKELDVSRQSVHIWLIRYKRFGIDGLLRARTTGKGVPYNKTPVYTEEKVIQSAKIHWQDGVETLHDWLLYEDKIELHPSTIFRILQRNKIRYVDSYNDTQRHWKKKLYCHEVDTTYPYGYGVPKVIYTAIDDATRIVYMYAYEKATALNTIDFLQRLIARTPFNIQKIRTDQGKEFIAKIVEKFLQENDIVHRANTPYSPEENGKIERFHGTLNSKCLRFGPTPDQSLDEFNYVLTLFLNYYNYIKKHRGLGMNRMSPYEKLLFLNRSLGSYLTNTPHVYDSCSTSRCQIGS